MRLSPPLALALLIAAGTAAGCSGPGVDGPDANVVFLASPTCRTFVVKTFEGGFGVLETREAGYAPQAADLLEGDLRRGEELVQFIPARALHQGEDAQPVDVRVVARDLQVEDAQAQYRTACPLADDPIDEELPDEAIDDGEGDA